MSRALAADAVQHAGHGHPGTAIALAPVAYLLFQKHLRHDPADPNWEGRDRFILSIGHSSLTLYTQLWLSGYGLEIDDLKVFRKAGSLTPAHPEFGHTAGVETTTGPLGQGIANAVGLAMALRRRQEQAGGSSNLDQRVFALAGDGCLQEGVAAEAASFAGHLKLSGLTVVYDDNRISIDGSTALTFTEDVCARFEAYGWNTLSVPKLPNGDVDIEALDSALESAQSHIGPTLIRLESTIAWPAPNFKGLAKTHGSALGADEVAALKRELGQDPEQQFFVDDAALAHAREVVTRGAEAHRAWTEAISTDSASQRVLSSLEIAEFTVPSWEVGAKVATRKAGGAVLNALAPQLPALWGGSADLSESNGTLIEEGGSVAPESLGAANIHFGVREHAMGGILNGLALAGHRPYGGTFLVFSDYMRGAVRLSALMGLPVTYVWSHDSIGLGEDGPTHQPVEHLQSLRLIPRFHLVRPADGNETAAAWAHLLKNKFAAGLALSRQDLPVVVSSDSAAAGVPRGGYLVKSSPAPKVSLVGTGSEVSLCLAAAELLEAAGIATNVVSMPCTSWFDAQSADYRASVLIPGVLSVSVEAGSTQGWQKYAQVNLGVDDFGASASPAWLFEHFGLTAELIAKRVQSELA